MDLRRITVLVLTWNEEANLERVLSRLGWATRVLVLDSHSTDQTVSIVRSFPNTTLEQRAFDSHSEQCNYGLELIQTEWTLILDADYVCPIELSDELSALDGEHAGYEAAFRYACFGKLLRGTLYPPRTVLFRTSQSLFIQDGHTQRVVVDGSIGRLRHRLIHDDRKPLSRWVQSQYRYASLEADKLLEKPMRMRSWKERLRSFPFLVPVLTLFYCLFFQGLILDGRAGLYYTAQRVFAELLLSIEILDRSLRSRSSGQTATQTIRNHE